MFCFLGVFATPADELEREFARLWPSADFAKIESPIKAAAVRLTPMTEPSAEGELPVEIVDALKDLSVTRPQTRFLLLRADCWGGDCFFCGKSFEDGHTSDEEAGPESLRRMIRFLGADIGERQIFDPLRRAFEWRPLKA